MICSTAIIDNKEKTKDKISCKYFIELNNFNSLKTFFRKQTLETTLETCEIIGSTVTSARFSGEGDHMSVCVTTKGV